MAELPASFETEGDGGNENELLVTNDAEKGSDIGTISKEIQNLKAELKDVLCTLRESLRSGVKKDLDDFKHNINQQLAKVVTDWQLQTNKINEAES